MASIQSFLNGLYVVMYNRTADQNGMSYWSSQAGVSASNPASTSISTDTATKIGAAFQAAAPSYFDSQYASKTGVDFISQLYLNLGGTGTVDSAGLLYWGGVLASFGSDPAAKSKTAALFVQAFIDYSGTDAAALARQAVFTNKIVVSQSWVEKSAGNTFMNAGSDTTAAAFVAQQKVLLGVTGDAATRDAAISQISSAVSAGNVTGVVGQVAPGAAYTLTTGLDAKGVGAFASGAPAAGSIFYASYNNGTATTLNAGDTVAATGSNNVMTLSDGASTAGGDLTTGAFVVTGVQGLTVLAGEQIKVNTKSAIQQWTGLTSISATTASGAGVDDITSAATTSITVADAATAVTGGVKTSGGNNITITESGNASTGGIVVGGSSTTNPAGAVAVTVSGSGATTVATDGGTTTSVTSSQTGAITIGANNAPTGAVTVVDTNGKTTGGLITVSGGASLSLTQNAAASATSGVVGQANQATISGITGAIGVTQKSVSVKNALTVDSGTDVTISTTGNFAAGSIAVGGTTGATGAVSITDTNSIRSSADAISVDVNGLANTTGAISVTTGATSGAIAVGSQTALKGVSGNVTISNQTTAGGKTWYGTGTVNVGTLGSTSVSVTGGAAGGGSSIVDESATSVLSTVSLTGFQGAFGVTSKALSTLNINNSLILNPANAAVSATSVTVTNTTDAHALTVNLSNTKSGTAVTDAKANTITIVDSGTTSDNINFTAGYAGKHNYTFTNNGTGTFTVGTMVDTGVASGSTVKLTGTGAITFSTSANTAFNTSNYATIDASGASGAVTLTVDSAVQGFTGGSGANVVTVTSAAGGISQTIYGGTGTNNTLVLTSGAANYTTALGGSLGGFQNLRLSGSSVAGSYAAGSFTGGLSVTGLVSATASNSVTFTNVTANTGLAVNAQAATSSATIDGTAGAYAANDTVVINGKTVTLTSTTQAQTVLDINGAKINGVTASAGAGSSVVISGASTVALGTAVKLTSTSALGGAISETLATAAQSVTGNSLPITLSSATNTAKTYAVVDASNNQAISINSVLAKGKASSVANFINITDSTATAQGNNATSLTITGAGNLTATYSQIGTATNALATINASAATGAVDVTNVQGATTGLTITGGSGTLTASGSGAATGLTAASYYAAVDTITTGSGGGTLTVGYAGAGGAAGTTTINLAASTAKTDTIKAVTDLTVGARATINNFVATSASTADKFTFQATKTVVATNATAAASANTDTYTVSNGVVTFTGNDTLAQKITNAQSIVNNSGTNKVVAFGFGSNTYVVTSGGTADTAHSSVYTLNGVSGVTQVGGSLAALGNIWAINVTGASATLIATSSTTAYTQSDAGYAVQDISGSGTGLVTVTNLAPSALINDTTSATHAMTVSQAGTAGSNALQITSATNGHTYSTLTVTGASALTLDGTQAVTVTSLVDSGNTLATLNIGGSGAVTVSAITDTALSAIKVSGATPGAVTIGAPGTPISQTLTETFGTSTATSSVATGSSSYLSGANSKIDLTYATSSDVAANIVFSATGTGSTVLGGASAAGGGVNKGYTIITGDNGTVTFATGTAAAVGVDAVAGDAGLHAITVGKNSTVTLGTTAASVASDLGSTITVKGDTAGTTSSGAYGVTTINNANDNTTKVVMFAAGSDGGSTMVNVASASSLAQALDLAVAVGTNGGTAGNNYYAEFHWTDGNTYLVGHSGAAAAALSANDVVVKMTGLLDGTVASAANVITI